MDNQLSLTSFYFLLFYAAILILYYVLPKKCQWMLLLAASVFYYLCSGNAVLILYPLAATGICFVGLRYLCWIGGREKELREAGRNPGRQRKAVLVSVILLLLSALVALKYVNFGINTVNGIAFLTGRAEPVFSGFQWLIPLGISYYSLSLIGYVTDVYFGIAKPVANPFRLALYGMYFPVMVSGPILRYREDGEQFFEPHPLDYTQVVYGMQRMLWGFFQKLVISERMSAVVNTVYGNYAGYPGIYIWIGTVCFAFQLYTDFSGCMDIVLGMSQTFGLKLPENFDRPFFSRTISEYWRRWHITLGVWMKEYVFYPLLRSGIFTMLSKNMRGRFGKKAGKRITTFTAMFILWFTVGLWHGGDWKYIIGSGLLHWFYIVAGELLEPWYGKLMKRFSIRPDSRGMELLRVLRTFFLVNIGFVFFRAASVGDAWRMLRAAAVWNPQTLWNGGLLSLGLDGVELTIAVVSLLLLLAVALRKRKGSVREQIAAKTAPVRWIIWYALLFYVILLGYYGPGYSAAEFIYQGF